MSIPFLKAASSWPNTFQVPHLCRLSPWGLGFPCMDLFCFPYLFIYLFEGAEHSDHRNEEPCLAPAVPQQEVMKSAYKPRVKQITESHRRVWEERHGHSSGRMGGLLKGLSTGVTHRPHTGQGTQCRCYPVSLPGFAWWFNFSLLFNCFHLMSLDNTPFSFATWCSNPHFLFF